VKETDILGGIVVRLQDMVIDLSLANELKEIKKKAIGTGNA